MNVKRLSKEESPAREKKKKKKCKKKHLTKVEDLPTARSTMLPWPPKGGICRA